jgi:hypothetical protein
MKEKIMRQRRVELGMRHRKLANRAKGGVFFSYICCIMMKIQVSFLLIKQHLDYKLGCFQLAVIFFLDKSFVFLFFWDILIGKLLGSMSMYLKLLIIALNNPYYQIIPMGCNFFFPFVLTYTKKQAFWTQNRLFSERDMCSKQQMHPDFFSNELRNSWVSLMDYNFICISTPQAIDISVTWYKKTVVDKVCLESLKDN